MDDEKPFSSAKRNSGTLKKRPRPQFDIGKQKRRNLSGDHASSASKPIDTSYRILCPVKKIGSVLGKGGEIINALRDQTHAKIRIADAIPGAEDRVVIIFSYLPNHSGEFDADQDPKNADKDTQAHCPAQDALLKVHDRIVADEYFRGGVVHEKTELDDEVTARILVPKNQVGCLLGKGGTIIKKMRSDTGASIRILPAEHLPPCAMDTDELVQISGAPSSVKKGLYEISTMLHQHSRKENPPLEELLYVSTQGLNRSGVPVHLLPQRNHGWSHQHPGAHVTPPIALFNGHRNGPSAYGLDKEEITDEFSMRILCCTGRIGGVIGKGGVNVRQLEQNTGAKIKIEETAPEAEERIVLVTTKEAPWDQISPTIDAVLQLQSRTSTISEDGIVTTRLLVPSGKVGCILGQGGSIINEMRRRTGADIRVYAKDDKPKYAPDNEELVQISGNQTVAEEALFEIASRLRTRTLRPTGNSAVNPAPSGPSHGFAPSESMPGRGLPPYDMFRAEDSAGYGYSKVAGPRNEAHGYRGQPTTAGYSAGRRHEVQGYPGSETVEYIAGPRHEAQGYPGAATAPRYNAGQRHEPQDYPGAATATGYSSGQRHDAQGYPSPIAAGYNSGQKHEAQGYSGPPITTGYNTGPRHEGQGYQGPPTAGGYSTGPRHGAQGYQSASSSVATNGAGSRHEAQGYLSASSAATYGSGSRPEGQGYQSASSVAATYGAGSRHGAPGYPSASSAAATYGAGSGHEAQGYPTPVATAYNTGPRHEGQSYPGAPSLSGYNTVPRYEVQGYLGAQNAALYNAAAPGHESQSHPGPPNVAGYPNINSYVEVKIPNSAVPSVLGVGGSNISDIHQISGARVKLHDPLSGASECVLEIHGSSEQIKSAESLLQPFISSGGQNAQLPPQVRHMY